MCGCVYRYNKNLHSVSKVASLERYWRQGLKGAKGPWRCRRKERIATAKVMRKK